MSEIKVAKETKLNWTEKRLRKSTDDQWPVGQYEMIFLHNNLRDKENKIFEKYWWKMLQKNLKFCWDTVHMP